MKVGDLVKFVHKGQVGLLLGIVTGDYNGDKMPDMFGKYKNVLWIDRPGIRPINTRYLEVISESR